VKVAFATAPEIGKRLGAGDPVDIVLAPPPALDHVVKAGNAVASGRVTAGRIGIGVAVGDNAPVPRIATVAGNQTIRVGCGIDPTQSGLAGTFARPGGDVMGLTNLSGELCGKRLELLKDVVPKATRFVLLEAAGGAATRANLPAAQAAAQAQRVNLQVLEVNAENPDFDGAFRIMVSSVLVV
jgi:putative ABC transport system substrate-binding protein